MSQPWYARAYDQRYLEAYGDEFTAEQTEREVDGLLERLSLPPKSRILDLCCGFGRHSIALSKRGFRVTGLDLSPALLAHARKSADAAGVAIEWIEADMRQIPVPDAPYDAAVNLFSSFGFFDDDREQEGVARAVHAVLAPGAPLLIETVNREIMLRKWQSVRWREREGGRLELHKLRFDLLSGILHSDETVVYADGRREADEHHTRMWTFTELASLLCRCGFGDAQAWGGLDGSRYTWDSHRMVVAAPAL